MKIRIRHAAVAASAALTFAVAAANDLTLGVSEGTSGGLDHAQVINKYQGLGHVIGRSIDKRVNVVFVREFSALEEGMKTGRFDFVMARPSDYPARGLRDYQYRFIATAKPDGQCQVVVPKDSPLQQLADIKGKRLVMPEEISYMTKFCRAAMRDQGITLAKEKVKYVREQGAVGFYLEQKLADAGMLASYSGVARKWEKDGHRVLYKSVPQPYFPLIANKRIDEAQVAAIQKSLQAMPASESGQAVLQTVGVKEFDTSSEKRLRALLEWLER